MIQGCTRCEWGTPRNPESSPLTPLLPPPDGDQSGAVRGPQPPAAHRGQLCRGTAAPGPHHRRAVQGAPRRSPTPSLHPLGPRAAAPCLGFPGGAASCVTGASPGASLRLSLLIREADGFTTKCHAAGHTQASPQPRPHSCTAQVFAGDHETERRPSPPAHVTDARPRFTPHPRQQ